MGPCAAAVIIVLFASGSGKPVAAVNGDGPIPAALAVLGQRVNPVRVAGAEEIRAIYGKGGVAPPAGLNAFRAPYHANDPAIYVNGDSELYRRAARTLSPLVLLQLAATLLHEQVHNTDGEAAAYRLQSDFVRDRLQHLPGRVREDARRYIERLDARANAHAWVAERLRTPRR
jgi:hypothetical protein